MNIPTDRRVDKIIFNMTTLILIFLFVKSKNRTSNIINVESKNPIHA